jgi:hypothetical protein
MDNISIYFIAKSSTSFFIKFTLNLFEVFQILNFAVIKIALFYVYILMIININKYSKIIRSNFYNYLLQVFSELNIIKY